MVYVSIEVSDGLGNRFFQVTVMLGYAEKYGHTPVFIRPWILKNDHSGPRGITDYFPDIPLFDTVPDGEWTHFKEKPEDFARFTNLPYIPTNIKLCGFFQSALYFPLKRSMIPKILVDNNTSLDNYVFFHIRRGDFLKLPHHFIDLINYYRRALLVYPEDTVFLVCSDDMDWCFKNVPNLFNVVGAHRWRWMSNNSTDYDTWRSMSQCARGGICANSTFSWWAGYFVHSRFSGKIIMPRIWGRPPMLPVYDIWPSWAVVIDC